MGSASAEQKQAEEGSVAWWAIHVHIPGQDWLAGWICAGQSSTLFSKD